MYVLPSRKCYLCSFTLRCCSFALFAIMLLQLSWSKAVPSQKVTVLNSSQQLQLTLSELKGHSVSLFYFCGCDRCHKCAEMWAQMQRSDVLPQGNKTVVVFMGPSSQAVSFQRDTGLLAANTTLLADPEMKAEQTFGVTECPRVFIESPAGIVKYTNNHSDDGPMQKSPVAALTRAVSALNSSTGVAPKPKPLTLDLNSQSSNGTTGGAVHVYNFGEVDGLTTHEINLKLYVRNSQSSASTIFHISTSCGCTTVTPNAMLPFVLHPGKKLLVRIKLDLTSQHPGDLDKYVWIFSSGQPNPGVVLELKGRMISPIRFSPMQVDFGHLDYGSNKTLPLSIWMDDRLINNGVWPKITSSVTSVQIKTASQPQSAMFHGNDGETTTYNITIPPNAPIGNLEGEIYFVPQKSLSQPLTVLLSSETIPVFGTVVGKLSASPSMFIFSGVKPGAAAKSSILITSQTALSLTGMHVKTNSKALTVSIHPLHKGRTSNKWILVVTLKKEQQSNQIHSNVELTTSSGEKLEIPVLASFLNK